MNWGERPVIVLGHGMRAAGVDPAPLLKLGVPILTSWQAADLVCNRHPLYYGRPGIYGQRCANKVFYEADQIVAIGNRMTPWQIGHGGIRPEQRLIMVDCDGTEVARFASADWVNVPIEDFIRSLSSAWRKDWLMQCAAWREEYPWIEDAHDDANGYINSYRAVARLEHYLRHDAIIVTDVGANMCPVFQVLHVKPPQRVITSGGLGEMGCSLPAAIGASFARAKGEVVVIAGDGGLMMNLQELQTIVHHNLPIKIIVFENDGYAMIKGTHKNLGMPYSGVDKASGVSFPSFAKLAYGFGIQAAEVRTWEDFDKAMPQLFAADGPALVEIHIDPEQRYVPRLQPIVKDGKITPARFDQLSPIL